MNAGCYRIRVRDIAGEGMGNGFFQFKDSNNNVIMKGGGAAGQFSYELASEVQCDGTLSVKEPEKDLPMVYPNPTQGLINLNLGSGLWQVQVFDLIGRKVMERQCEGRSSIDLSKQPKGLYLMRAQNGIEEVNTKVVVY
jgi:hypothetical protein